VGEKKIKKKNRDTHGRRIAQAIIAQYKLKSVVEKVGYEPNSCEEKETTNRRQVSFDSMIFPKHKRDVFDIENKVLAMYARGMSQRDISAIIDDIYGFKLSAEQIFKITDYVLEEQKIWQNRTLAPFTTF